MSRGKLIVIEGLDGSGKATQTKMICEKLENKGNIICKLSFPDYNEPSSALVKMYLNSEFGPSPDSVNVYAASSFYAVDRYASYKKFWEYKYKNGQIIIADRYTTSNIIYQLGRLDKSLWSGYIKWIQDYEYNKLNLPEPDMVIYLDMPVEISQRFMSERYNGDETQKDIYEKNIDFLNKCKKTSLYAAEKLNWKIVSCCENGKPKTIKEINSIIENLIEGVIS